MTSPRAWDDLPLILKAEHMAALLDVQVSTIWRRCQQRRMRPPPDAYQRPYIWSRAEVQAHFERRIPLARGQRRRVQRAGPLPTTVAPLSVTVKALLAESARRTP